MDLDAGPRSAATLFRYAALAGNGQPFDGRRPPGPGIPYRSLDCHRSPLCGAAVD